MSRPLHILEANPVGHRPFYLRWILAGRPAGRQVVIHAPAGTMAHPALSSLPADSLNGVTLAPFAWPDALEPKGKVALARMHLAKVKAYAQRCREVGLGAADTVLVPFVDDLSYGMSLRHSLLGGPRLAAVGMRADLHVQAEGITGSRRQTFWRRWLQLRLLRNRDLAVYYTNQLPMKQHIDKVYPDLSKRVAFVPDPAEEPQACDVLEARRQLGLPGNRPVILLFGSIRPRKGLARLLAAMADSSWPGHAQVVIAGEIGADARSLIESPFAQAARADGRLVVRDGAVPASEEGLLYQAAKLVWLLYEGHEFMSGVLVTAGRHGRPVIGCAEGLIGWYIRRFGLGVACAHDASAGAMAAAVARAMTDTGWCDTAGEAGRKAFARHSVADFSAVIWAHLPV